MEKELRLITSDEFIKIINGDFQEDEVYLNFYTSGNDRIYFESIKITDDLVLNGRLKPIKKVEIYESDFKNITITHFKSQFELSFNSTIIHKNFWIVNATLPELSFNDCSLPFQFRIFEIQTESFHIQESCIRSITFLNRSSFNKDTNIDLLTISESKIEYLNFDGGNYKESELAANEIVELSISGGKFESLDINYSIIEKINFSKNGNKGSKIVLSNIQAFKISFEYFINYGLLYKDV